MAEFHIAHEQMIQGRKKYLIPLMLEEIKSADIKDADLRMYVESHTYLDCKDLVRFLGAEVCQPISVFFAL